LKYQRFLYARSIAHARLYLRASVDKGGMARCMACLVGRWKSDMAISDGEGERATRGGVTWTGGHR